jgi:hypothetical protein
MKRTAGRTDDRNFELIRSHAAPLVPALKNFTSSPPPGAAAPAQLLPFDQFVSVPLAPFQITVPACARGATAREIKKGVREY